MPDNQPKFLTKAELRDAAMRELDVFTRCNRIRCFIPVHYRSAR